MTLFPLTCAAVPFKIVTVRNALANTYGLNFQVQMKQAVPWYFPSKII